MSQDLPPETERAIFITIPLKDIIPFNGYLALWSFKAYWFCVSIFSVITAFDCIGKCDVASAFAGKI